MKRKWRGSYHIIIISLIIVICISGGTVAREEESGVYTLDALNINYDYKENMILASGNVIFQSGEFKIKAEEVVINTRLETVEARGEEILLSTPRQEVEGEYLQYNYSKRTGSIYGAKSKLNELNFRGGVIELVEGKDYQMMIEDASFTPCILTEPHYQFKASRIKIYPDNKVVGKNIQFWWGNLKLFSLPGYVLEFDEDGKLKDRGPTPHVGYDSEDGISLEITYPYEISDRSKGDIYVQGSQHGGRNIKLDNIFQISGDTTLNSKYINRKEIDDDSEEKEESFSTVLEHRVNKNFTLRNTFEYTEEVEDGDTDKEKLFKTGFTYHKQALELKSDVGYDFISDNRIEEISLGYKPADKYYLKLYHDYINENIDHRSYTLSSTASTVNWNLYYRDGYELDYSPYLEMMFPEYSNIKTTLGMGRVSNEGVTLDKVMVDLNYNKTFSLTDRLAMDFNQGLVGNFYNWPVSNSYRVLTTNIGLNYQNDLSQKVNIGGGIYWEKTTARNKPLIPDDEVEEGEILETELDLTFLTSEPQSAWIIGNENQYNIETEEWEKIALKITRKHDCYSLSLAYDFENEVIGFSINL